jgi:hypothetical protein
LKLALVRFLLRRELHALERRIDRRRFDRPLSLRIDAVRMALEALGA